MLTTLSRARAPLAAFASMGVLWGGFAADLPDIKTMLGVNEQGLGTLLFATPIAAVCAMLLAPAYGVRAGGWALPLATMSMAIAFSLPGMAGSVWLFPLAMLAAGAGTGLTDVMMNARVADLENKHAAPLMNLCHAAYSFGLAGGALLVGGLRSAQFGPAATLGTIAALAALLALLTIEKDGAIAGLGRPKDKVVARLGLVPLIGGAIVLIAFLTENAAENWSALHIEQTLGGSPAAGAMGPAAMAMTMGFARLAGQGLAQRVAGHVLLTCGAALSATGALIAAAANSPAMAYAGFIIMGLGSSVIAPTAFSMVGQMAHPAARARAVARATLLGYFGYFFGPPFVGFLAGHFGLRAAFVFAAVLLASVPIWAHVLRRQR
jgi:predicted MFS family arabinose efflux permease